MSNETNKQKFEKLSFWQLLEKRSVEIPIIQRDYAQGREIKEKVRNDFLDALNNALKGNFVELDFVYGSEENNVLQPLDGQQRLTTLFLLHWFAAIKENRLEDVKVKGILQKLTYETRTSSREFCKELVAEGIDYQKLLPIDDEKRISHKNQLSETIKNSSWFVISWENDPTIKAMLIMLDAIQVRFKDTSDIWAKLIETAEDKRPITFLYIKLKDFGLSDDLYIKMNARGKQLTPFEEFKSRFEKHIKDNEWESELKPGENDNEEIIRKKLDKTFYHKIDTDWTDLFWKYKEKKEKLDDNGVAYAEYEIDRKIINFIAGIAINCYAQNLEIAENKDAEEKMLKELVEKEKNKTITNEAINRERIEKRIAVLANNPTDVNYKDFPTKKSFEYLKDCLNKYGENDNAGIRANIPLWGYCDTTLFEDMIFGQNTTQQKRVLFYAQTAYLLKNIAFNQTEFNEWMRVIRNIIENAISGNWNVALMVNLIQLVAKLAGHANDIYAYLADSTTKLISATAREQIKEEIEKAKIIGNNSINKKIIQDVEDTDFCKGKLEFVLYCIDYDIDKKNQPDNFNADKLSKMLFVINTNFKTMGDKLSDDFKRAFLTVGENSYYEIWSSWSWSFNCNKKWLLEKNKDLRDNFTVNKDWERDYLKELFVQLVSNSFQQIIDNYAIPSGMPIWKQRLIKKNGILNAATFILIPNNNEYCYLAWQQRPSREDQLEKIE
jgi:hypothetical protein